jgi:CRISPR-associated protein Cmr2
MSDDVNQPKALLSFFLGPVKSFLEAARPLRDLWTGSYLLSWLTIAAMAPVLRLARQRQGQAQMITPHIDDHNRMVAAYFNRLPSGDRRASIPCIPSRFRALVPAEEAATLREACLKSCCEEWEERICPAVRPKLAKEFDRRDAVWHRNWPQQVGSYFEMRCVALPLADCTKEKLDELGVEPDITDLWVRRMALLERLMDAAKSVRQVPPYRAQADAEGRFPVKCSLLGSFEQMGPAELNASGEFWVSLTARKKEPRWEGLQGVRLQKSDRLCAVSLVKRFAWPAYFAGKLGLKLKELRFSDTATVAARRWLADAEELDPDKVREEKGHWSGQWLHWQQPDQEEDEEPCPPDIWERIQKKKRLQGRPPTYYAILWMDGDRMGELFQGKRDAAEWGEGLDRYRKITEQVSRFALELVREVVEAHRGELIYAGGDDLLALLPTDEVITCARKLRDDFASSKCLGKAGLIKAGVAVVHHKEDLRFALHMAREAEEAAKAVGRNALALTVCRRSGEHTTAVMAWPHTVSFNQLVEAFREDTSDRWTYKLRGELVTLCHRDLPWAASAAEVKRLLGRAEGVPEALPDTIKKFMQDYYDEMVTQRGREGAKSLTDFVVLCQSASFLARGKD